MHRRWQGDYRPAGGFMRLRTVCHGCRQTTHVHVTEEGGVSRLRTLVLAGDGTVLREVAPGHLVNEPCPVCRESEDPGWQSGFQPPA